MGRTFIDLTGQTFGRWEVLGPHKNIRGRVCWQCKCSCGKTIKFVNGNTLRNGESSSCGCALKEAFLLNSIDGKSKSNHPLYSSYTHMMDRCYNEKCKSYKNYGGRGIYVYDEWHDFSKFCTDMGDRPKGKTLNRIDNDGHYCKKNCNWADPAEQNNNRRNNIYITASGKTRTLGEWAAFTGHSFFTLHARHKRGWDADLIINGKPRGFKIDHPKILIKYNGEHMSVAKASELSNVKARTIYSRYANGLREEELFKSVNKTKAYNEEI